MTRRMSGLAAAVLAFFGLAVAAETAAQGAAQKPPTAEEAKAFVEAAEQDLLKLWIDTGRADWVKSTYITDDTEILAAQANEKSITAGVRYAKQATRFDGLKVDAETERKLRLLKLSLTVAAPADPAEAAELTRLGAAMEGMYGKGKYCPPEGKCLDLEDITKIMATSRDAKQLLDVWDGWHTIAPPMQAELRALRRARQQGRARARLRRHGRDVALEVRHAARRSSRPSSTGSGSRSGRSTSRCTPTCAGSCARSTATPSPRTGRSRRTCSATCGRRTGTTSTRSSRRRAPTPATT